MSNILKRKQSTVVAVERPGPDAKGCWAMVRRYANGTLAPARHCEVTPQPGNITCRHHSKWETVAQRIRAMDEKRKAALRGAGDDQPI